MEQFAKSVVMILLLLAGEAFLIEGLHVYLLQRCHTFEEERITQNDINRKIQSDMKCFPVPLAYREEVSYEDTYGEARQNGGHDGCDIMDLKNQPGRIPVISATDGIVTNIGWLYLGGYRIGITSEEGIYYYYAHLDSYAAGISAGKTIQAGELLGFMGNTGEGQEGTEGNFPVHLHFGIYIQNTDGDEEPVNSYLYLQKIDDE
ncbi:MAG: M23 family metallopeptidase [Lachnospiraceae bacterium]